MSARALASARIAEPPVTPLRRLPIPVVEPNPARRITLDADDRVAPTQGTLALALPVREAEDDDAEFQPRSTPSSVLPEPRAWAAQFVQAAVEVAAGVRSPGQLMRWTSLEVHAMLARRSALSSRIDRASTSSRRAVVRAVLACQPDDGVCEASAVVVDRGRVRAVALRMEGLDGRWRVTALELV